MNTITTSLHYLNKKYVNEKVAGESVFTEGGHRSDSLPHDVTIYNGRLLDNSIAGEKRLDKSGFLLHSIGNNLYETIKEINMPQIETDEILRLKYYNVIEKVVMNATNCDYVRAFNFTLRSSKIIGVHTKAVGDNSARGPVNDVHTDFTPTAPAVVSITQLSDSLGLKSCRFSLLNCWRNIDLKNPILHWPMAICDVNSIDHEHDLIPRISPENGNHIYNLLPNKQHKWYTFPAQTAKEILLFKQYDTIDHLRCYTPHTAFNDPRSPKNAPPRNSCEVRCICWFDDEGKFTDSFKILHEKNIGLISNRVEMRIYGNKSKL